MSWIFGFILNNPEEKINVEKLSTVHPEYLYRFRDRSFYIVSGGLKETCLSNLSNKTQEMKWIINGTGIKYSKQEISFMDESDWNEILPEKRKLTHLNGHFVTVCWNKKEILCKNDQLGQRDMFFTQTESFIAFSTRLDWLLKLRPDCTINLEAYSSSWSLVNSLTYESFVTKIKRLGPGGVAIISRNSLQITRKSWFPDDDINLEREDPVELLRQFTVFPLHIGYHLDLGLSGGIDSRTLFSLLLSSGLKNWNVHSFGNSKMPDVQIAKKIAKYYKVDHLLYFEPFTNSIDCIKKYQEFVTQTLLFLPASGFMELGYYEKMYQKNKIIIDGGKGEYFRRIFANKLAIKGRKDLIKKDIFQIRLFLENFKTDIFNDEVTKIIYNASNAQIEKMLNNMPDPKDFGVGNWIDLFSIRYRTANNGSPSQSRLDHFTKNYMPFIQPTLLSAVFKTSIKKRRRAMLNKQILLENKKLMKFPLEKFDTFIPFQLNQISSYFSAKIIRHFYNYQDSETDYFLTIIKDFVQDTVRSSDVRNFELYDNFKIKRIVDQYYNGRKELKNQLIWWLTFDVWRELIYKKRNLLY